jgi:hypothetical protein
VSAQAITAQDTPLCLYYRLVSLLRAHYYEVVSNTIVGVYTFSALCVTWVATNLIPDHKRSVGLPFFYSIGNLSGLISSQLYPAKDSPRFKKGNAISAGLEVIALFFVFGGWFVLRRRSAKKAKLIAEGATTNGKEGDEGLDFKYTI